MNDEFYDDLDDVYNSSLYTEGSDEEASFEQAFFKNTTLKVGIITQVYDIDSKENKNKNFPEYDVLVVEQDGPRSMVPQPYYNCLSIDGFGGVADFFEYKLRPVEGTKKEEGKTVIDTNFGNQLGNMVLLLCLDGSIDKGIIVKAVSHRGRKTNLTKDAGLHLEGEYNGLNWKINKDGELTVTFKSKTNEKGEPQDEKAGGTHFQINKKGSVDINTNLEGDDETYMRMDKENKDVGLKAGANIGLTAKKNIGFNAEADIKGAAKANVEFAAEGSAKYSSKSAFDIMSDASLTVKAASVIVQSDGDFLVESSTALIDAPKVQLGASGTPALVQTTQFIGTGNLGAPVLSTAIGPFSSVVFISP